uniref:Uncharacterized protein n=1 Tax=viral metagenome TaxID=1070528 RepID=A0A6C0AF19_9ZZZZ
MNTLPSKLPSIREIVGDLYPKSPNVVGPYYEMDFGPYEGHNIMDIFEDAPTYAYWLFKSDSKKNDRYQEAKQSVRILYFLRYDWYCKHNPISKAENHRLTFGKYKDEKLSKIFKNHYEYCKWLVRSIPSREDMFEDWHKAQTYLKTEHGMGVSDTDKESVKDINDKNKAKMTKPKQEDDVESSDEESIVIQKKKDKQKKDKKTKAPKSPPKNKKDRMYSSEDEESS